MIDFIAYAVITFSAVLLDKGQNGSNITILQFAGAIILFFTAWLWGMYRGHNS